MDKFTNIVKVNLKKDSKKNYLKKIKNIRNFDGLISCKHIETGPNTYCMIEEWTSKDALMKARKIIEILDKDEPLINEDLSEIDIMDSVSGRILVEK